MRKLLALLLATILLLAACGSDTEKKEDDKASEVSTTKEQVKEEADDEKPEETQEVAKTEENESKEEVSESKESVSEEATEIKIDLKDLEAFVSYDASLTGMDLLNSVEYSEYSDYLKDKGFKLSADMVQANGETSLDFSAEMITYNYNSWQKAEMMGMTTYNITIVEDGMEKTYSYTEGDTEGNLMVDTFEASDEDMTPSIFDTYDPEFAPLIEARVEMLGDYETLYIEYGEEGYITKLWYYPALGASIKEQSFYNDTLVSDMTITSMEILNKVDKDLFDLPKDVEFIQQ